MNYPPSQGGTPPDPMPPSPAQAAGFLRSLFDFSFESFVSVRVLKVLYGLWLFMLVPSVFALFYAWYAALTYESYDYMTGQSSADPQFAAFCGSTVVYPMAVFLWVLIGRILFERSVLAFRQYDLSREILQELRRR